MEGIPIPGNKVDYRRQTARSRRAGQERQGDAVVFALTVQVILCLVLLLLALFVKKTDEARYSGFKTQYNVMVTDPAEREKALAFFSEGRGGLQQFFAAAEQVVDSILSKFTGLESPVEEEPVPPSVAASEDEEAVEKESPASSGFSYDYLGTDGEEDTKVLGQGGMFPVDTEGLNPDELPVPAGCTLAPVALTGKANPPVTGIITSEYAYRDHPVSGESDFHTGMDIASEEGRDILAALPGVVLETGTSDIYGNYVTIWHSANLQTFYAHCSEIIAGEGARVRQGERIAQVGQTGVATGPHLHFSVIVDGVYTDPYWVLQDNIELVG